MTGRANIFRSCATTLRRARRRQGSLSYCARFTVSRLTAFTGYEARTKIGVSFKLPSNRLDDVVDALSQAIGVVLNSVPSD
jgi:hypothetical protein